MSTLTTQPLRQVFAVLAVMPIRRYVGPQWFVEYELGWDVRTDRDSLRDMVASFNEDGYSIIDTHIRGWGRYNAIIRSPDGECDYLARLSPAP